MQPFVPLYPGCFGQHVLATLYADKATHEVNRLFSLVQGKVAGADGLSEAEANLAIGATLHGWNKSGQTTAEQIRADLTAGAALSDEETIQNIKKIATLMGFSGNATVISSVITFALAVAAADGLEALSMLS